MTEPDETLNPVEASDVNVHRLFLYLTRDLKITVEEFVDGVVASVPPFTLLAHEGHTLKNGEHFIDRMIADFPCEFNMEPIEVECCNHLSIGLIAETLGMTFHELVDAVRGYEVPASLADDAEVVSSVAQHLAQMRHAGSSERGLFSGASRDDELIAIVTAADANVEPTLSGALESLEASRLAVSHAEALVKVTLAKLSTPACKTLLEMLHEILRRRG